MYFATLFGRQLLMSFIFRSTAVFFLVTEPSKALKTSIILNPRFIGEKRNNLQENHVYEGQKYQQCLPKVLEHLCKFCLVLQFPPLPLRTMLCCGQKIGMIGRSATLLECWDNNLRNQHCFGGEGVFEPDGYG